MSDATLDMLVKIGVIGRDDIKAANELIAEYGKTAEKAGEGVEKFNVHGRELNHLAEMLNRVMPGAGEALKTVGHSGDQSAMAMIGLAAAIEIVSKSYEQLKENSKAADEAVAAIMAEHGDAEAVRAIAKAWEDAATEQEIYRLGLAQRHDDNNDPTKGAAERELNAAKAAAQGKEQLLKDEYDMGVASIQALEEQGLISHQQALTKKLALDQAYETARIKIQQDADAQDLSLKQGTLDTAKKQKAADDIAEQNAAVKESNSRHALEENKTNQEQFKKTGDAGRDEMAKSGISGSQEQEIRELYEKASGLPSSGKDAVSLQQQGDYLRKNNLYGNFSKNALSLGESADVNKLFGSWITGGANISDEQLAAYGGGEDVAQKADAAGNTLAKQQPGLEHTEALAKQELERQKQLLDEKSAQVDKLQAEVDELKKSTPQKEAIGRASGAIKLGTEAVKDNAAAGANIHDQASHNEAIKQLRESQRVGQQLAVAATNAAESHSAALPVISQALKTLRESNEKLIMEIQDIKSQHHTSP